MEGRGAKNRDFRPNLALSRKRYKIWPVTMKDEWELV